VNGRLHLKRLAVHQELLLSRRHRCGFPLATYFSVLLGENSDPVEGLGFLAIGLHSARHFALDLAEGLIPAFLKADNPRGVGDDFVGHGDACRKVCEEGLEVLGFAVLHVLEVGGYGLLIGSFCPLYVLRHSSLLHFLKGGLNFGPRVSIG